MRKRRALFLFALAALVALPASAFAADWSYDSAHTTVGFKVKHLGLVYVHGTFDEFSGTISWDGKDLTTGDASVTIKAASVNTSNAKRDKHLREGFFETGKFPDMTFKSTKVVSTGQDTAKVHGDLTIKDVTKPVVLDLTHLGTVEKDPWGNTRAAFSATTTINRKEFHVQEDSAADLAIGHDITIELDIVAIKPAE